MGSATPTSPRYLGSPLCSEADSLHSEIPQPKASENLPSYPCPGVRGLIILPGTCVDLQTCVD
jgi:hypothetical protein